MLLIGIHGNWLHQADHKQTDLEPTNLNWSEKGGHRNNLLSPELSCLNPHFVTKSLCGNITGNHWFAVTLSWSVDLACLNCGKFS